jgi:hypothetical protein
MEKVRNCSAATGYPVSRLVEVGLIDQLEKLEAEHGAFPQRVHRRLPGGPVPGGQERRSPMP